MDYTRLINCLWRAGEFSGRSFDGLGGEQVTVAAEGENAAGSCVWTAAEVVVDGERRRGPVVIGEETPVPSGAILRVAESAAPSVLGNDDRLVTQISYTPPSDVRDCYDRLLAGSGECACAENVASMDSLRRTALFTALSVERLQRKTTRIKEIFESTNRDWSQTFHILLFRAMGGDRNREAFTTLAGKAAAAMVSREKSVPERVEALLLGTAGFLFNAEPDEKDDYTLQLEDEARHLFAKYSIAPMMPAAWNLSKIYPANHPAVRLAEIAALFSKKDFILDGVLQCRSSEDIENLFSAGASDYWHTRYIPSGPQSASTAKTIGRTKAHLMGINLAAPFMFTYGKETGRDELCEKSLDLLASIPAEKNRLLAGWYEGGCVAESSFESQALLQLTGEYCAAGACADCRIGRAEIKKALAGVTIP